MNAKNLSVAPDAVAAPPRVRLLIDVGIATLYASVAHVSETSPSGWSLTIDRAELARALHVQRDVVVRVKYAAGTDMQEQDAVALARLACPERSDAAASVVATAFSQARTAIRGMGAPAPTTDLQSQRESYLQALRDANGHRGNAAAALGLARRTFYRHLQSLGLMDAIPDVPNTPKMYRRHKESP